MRMKSLENLRGKRLALFIVCGIVLAPHTAGPQTRRPGPSAVTVIEGATLIDGNGGTALKNSVIVIDGSRIRAVGARGSVSYRRRYRWTGRHGRSPRRLSRSRANAGRGPH